MTFGPWSARIAIGSLSLLVGAACTFVELTPQGEQVRVSTAEAVATCERVGRTKTRTAHKAWIFPRREAKVAEELASLARVDAVEMGGTDVVPTGAPEEGRQEFGIYRCAAGAPETAEAPETAGATETAGAPEAAGAPE